MANNSETCRCRCIIHRLDRFSLEDNDGMRVAIAMLDHSLASEQNGRMVQFDTFCKTCLACTNCYQADVEGLGDNIGAYERQRLWITGAPTQSFWFSRFVAGAH